MSRSFEMAVSVSTSSFMCVQLRRHFPSADRGQQHQRGCCNARLDALSQGLDLQRANWPCLRRQAHDCPPAQRLLRRVKAAAKLLGDKAYDSAQLRQWLKDRGTKAVVPNKSNRKQPFSFDKKSYRQRHRIENAFSRLKDFRRIATRYDKLARNFLASVCLVVAIVWWI